MFLFFFGGVPLAVCLVLFGKEELALAKRLDNCIFLKKYYYLRRQPSGQVVVPVVVVVVPVVVVVAVVGGNIFVGQRSAQSQTENFI